MTKNEIIEIGLPLLIDQISWDVLSGRSTSDLTLRLSVFGKNYSKTMPLKDSQDENRVKNHWSELLEILKKDLGVGNVPTSNNNPKEDDMSVQEKLDQLGAVALELVAEVKAEGGQYTQADIEAAKKEGFDAAVAADTTPISQEKYDALEALFKDANATIEGVKAALKLVPTPVVETPVEAAPIEETPVVEAQP